MSEKMQNLIVPTVIGAALGFLLSYIYLQSELAVLKGEISLRPPIIVVDMAKLAFDSVPLGSSKEAIDTHFLKTRSAIDKLKNAGFLVIPRENIISVPSDLMLNVADVYISGENKVDE